MRVSNARKCLTTLRAFIDQITLTEKAGAVVSVKDRVILVDALNLIGERLTELEAKIEAQRTAHSVLIQAASSVVRSNAIYADDELQGLSNALTGVEAAEKLP